MFYFACFILSFHVLKCDITKYHGAFLGPDTRLQISSCPKLPDILTPPRKNLLIDRKGDLTWGKTSAGTEGEIGGLNKLAKYLSNQISKFLQCMARGKHVTWIMLKAVKSSWEFFTSPGSFKLICPDYGALRTWSLEFWTQNKVWKHFSVNQLA